MPTITLVEFSGAEHPIEAEAGKSLMQNALDNAIPGIDADCGGECSCATCHVLIPEAWMEKVGTASEQENSMLDLNPDRQDNSRLSCQIELTDDLDGLVVNLPEFQY